MMSKIIKSKTPTYKDLRVSKANAANIYQKK